jgi:O-antigen/teichoic acid export membrane protein
LIKLLNKLLSFFTPTSLGRNIFLSGITIIQRFIVNGLVLVIFARFVGVTEFGRLGFGFAFAGIFISFYDFGLNLYLVKTISKDRLQLQIVFYHAIIIKVFLVLFGSAIALFTLIIIKSGDSEIIRITLYLLFSILFINLSALIFSIFKSFNLFKYELITTSLYNLVFLLLSAALWYKQIIDINNIALVYLISRFIFLIISISIFNKVFNDYNLLGTKKVNFKGLMNMIREVYPFGVTSLIAVVYLNIDTLFISEFQGDYAVGIYHAATRIIMVSFLIKDSLDYAVFPKISEIYNRYDFNEKFKIILVVYSFIGIVFTIFFNIFSKTIILLLYGSDYIIAYEVLSILSIIFGFIYIQSIIIMPIQINGNQSKIAIMALWNAVVLIIISYLLIPQHSFIGAAIALLLSRLFGFIFSLIIYQKIMGRINSILKLITPMVGIGILTIILKSIMLSQNNYTDILLFCISTLLLTFISYRILISQKVSHLIGR